MSRRTLARIHRTVGSMADEWVCRGYAVSAVCRGYRPPEPIAGWRVDLRASGHGREIAVVVAGREPRTLLGLMRRYELARWATSARGRQLHWITLLP